MKIHSGGGEGRDCGVRRFMRCASTVDKVPPGHPRRRVDSENRLGQDNDGVMLQEKETFQKRPQHQVLENPAHRT